MRWEEMNESSRVGSGLRQTGARLAADRDDAITDYGREGENRAPESHPEGTEGERREERDKGRRGKWKGSSKGGLGGKRWSGGGGGALITGFASQSVSHSLNHLGSVPGPARETAINRQEKTIRQSGQGIS